MNVNNECDKKCRKKFHCREWAFQKLAHCLDQRPIAKTCGALILGGPGSGKTTFCQELVSPTQGPSGRQQRALNRRLLGSHFLINEKEESLEISEFLRNLVGQILSYSSEGLKQKSIRRRQTNQQHHLCDHISLGKKLLKRSLSEDVCTDELEAEDEGITQLPPLCARTVVADAYYEKLLNDKLMQKSLRVDEIEKNPDDCLKTALLFPLLEIDPPKQCLFIIVDSIDEIAFRDDLIDSSTLTKTSSENSKRTVGCSRRSETIAELLSNHYHLLPQWLLLVCTARKQSKTISKMFTGFRKLSLDDLRKSQVVRDVQQYILSRLDDEMDLRSMITKDTADCLNQLHIKSNACFLYLEKVLNGIKQNFIILREIKQIPGTLNGLYLWLCQRIFNKKHSFDKVKPILNVLLANRYNEPINKIKLYHILRTQLTTLTYHDYQKRLNLIDNILIVEDCQTNSLKFFHHSFAQWLLDIKHCTQKYLCNLYEGDIMLAMYYYLNGKDLTKWQINRFATHLIKIKAYLKFQKFKIHNFQNPLLYVNIKQLSAKSSTNHTSVSSSSSNNEIKNSLHLNDLNKEKKLFKYVYMDGDGFEEGENKDEEDIVRRKNEIENELNLLIQLWLITSNCNVNIANNSFSDDWYDDWKDYNVYISRDERVRMLIKNSISISQTTISPTSLDTSLNQSSQISKEENVEAIFEVRSNDLFESDINGRTLLHCLCAEGNLNLLQLVLDEKRSQNEEINLEISELLHGQTPLNVAASHGHTQIVKLLLDFGANINHADSDGWTALRAAAWGGHIQVVNILLEYGCEVDSIDCDHRTALRAAAWSGHLNIVKALIQHGADVNKTDLEGRTALIAAAYMGHSDIVEHLLDSGAEIDHEDLDGRTALSVATLCVPSNQGYAKVVQILLERGAKVDHQDKDGMTPLLVAAFEGHKDVCELLLEYEADIEHADNTGRTPLWAAACMGHASVVGLLLFWGCQVDTIEPQGRTVLSMAAAQGCIDVVSLLLDRGLDEQHRDNAGWTPLHYAAFEGHKQVCEALLESGAKIDSIDNDGKCPLILAAQEGHLHLLQLFIKDYEADVNQATHDGKTALRMACCQGHFDCVRFLIECGADVNYKDADSRSTLYVLALDNRVSMARYLIQHSTVDVEATDSEGRTALHVSCWQGHYDMVQLLLTQGRANVNSIDYEQRSALHSASWQGHSNIVRLLLEHGAIPDHACNQGATALGISGQQGHEECVRALLEYGADPMLSDCCGRNALRVAYKSGHSNIVKLLQQFAKINQNSDNSINSGGCCLADNLVDFSAPNKQQHQQSNSLSNSNNSKSSNSNLTTSSHSSQTKNKEQIISYVGENKNEEDLNKFKSFTEELQTQLSQVHRQRPLHSPIYASPPTSPPQDVKEINNKNYLIEDESEVEKLKNGEHFNRDTHMRIILGSNQKKLQQQNNFNKSTCKMESGGVGVVGLIPSKIRNVKNGLLDSAANKFNKQTPSIRTNSFQWRKETPL